MLQRLLLASAVVSECHPNKRELEVRDWRAFDTPMAAGEPNVPSFWFSQEAFCVVCYAPSDAVWLRGLQCHAFRHVGRDWYCYHNEPLTDEQRVRVREWTETAARLIGKPPNPRFGAFQ